MADYYNTCYPCRHVFKPKRLTKQQLERREFCICMCHWKERFACGITFEDAKQLLYNSVNKNE